MKSAFDRCATLGALLAAAWLVAGCERPPVETVQRGYRGTAMVEMVNPRTLATQAARNTAPEDSPPALAVGPTAGQTFKNVKVLGDLSVLQFARTMVSLAAWVAPNDGGCTYCHKAGEDFSSDALYTKVVARRMLEMTRHINTDWKPHVAATGVTCYTCHRGHPVPEFVWTAPAPDHHDATMLGSRAGKNSPAATVGLSALPYDPFTPFLLDTDNDIRVIGTQALPGDNHHSIKQAEFTYGLMVHMAQALGVNCTYCHNSRSFADWNTSTPQRATAWYGIRMVRDLNNAYLVPLAATFPPNRHGPAGDGPKLNCATCHQGAFKPLYGASMVASHPELVGAVQASVVPAAAASAPVASRQAVLLFAVGSATLEDAAAAELKPLAEALKSDPAARLTISGFHSAAGDLAQNEDLAKRRAFAVRDALKALGVAEDRIALEKPQSAEANLSGEDPQARRVEVALK